jgi:hypothetical protein
MNIQEIYELGLAQGWDENDAYYLATIAWAESAGVADKITDEPHNTKSYGVWQIHDIHIPKLIEAGIITSVEDLLDPTTNAIAAYHVGHHLDKTPGTRLPEEFKDKWDWSRWTVTELPLTDVNHPSKYGEDVTRGIAVDVDALNAEIPDDFKSTITGTKEWTDRIEEWGLDNDGQNALMDALYHRFVNGFGPDEDNPTGWRPDISSAYFSPMEIFMGEDGDPVYDGVYNSVQSFFDSLSYIPSSMKKQLPSGWLKFWGEDTPEVGDWLKDWEDRFEENRNNEVNPFLWPDLEEDFLADLETQGWWTQHTQEYRDLTQLWYTGGGPGGEMRDGELFLGEGDPMVAEHGQFESLLGKDYTGSGDWRATWEANKVVAASILEDLDGRLDGSWASANSKHLNNIAFMLMREGGASNYYHPNDAWATTAASKIERYAAKNIFTQGQNMELQSIGTEGLGAGSVQDVVNRLRNRAKGQLWNIDDATLREWAIGIKTEEGPNEAQRMAEIDAHAYGSWGLTPDQQEGMGEWAAQGSPGTTISDLVNPAWEGAVTLWDDDSYRKDDPWLMDHYQVVNDDGSKRFRTRQEMRDVARTNLDRFQHSKEYQDPLNQFLTRAAAMFRSDY